MSTDLAVNGRGIPRPVEMPRSEAIERALINGDLSGLSHRERLDYYTMRCEAAGLDPRSQPFQYITLPGRQGQPGKLVLYATKATGDQLIAKHRLTVAIKSRGFDRDTGCYVVEAQATFPAGQTVEDVGAVAIPKDAYGEAVSNAVMKCVTKAKRRTVLSACGLGMLDESEVGDIAGAVRINSEGLPLTIERPATPGLVHEPVNEPREEHVSDLKSFIRTQIQTAKDELRNAMLIDGKGDDFPQIAKNHLPNEFAVANHLITGWIETGALEASEITLPNGRRDRAKAGAALQVAYGQDPEEVETEIREYLNSKLREAAKAGGVWLVGDQDESQATADED